MNLLEVVQIWKVRIVEGFFWVLIIHFFCLFVCFKGQIISLLNLSRTSSRCRLSINYSLAEMFSDWNSASMLVFYCLSLLFSYIDSN